MVKLVMTAMFFALLATNVYAADLSDAVLSTQLSNAVEGNYFSNASATGATDGTAYVLATAHVQGDKNYASGSFSSKVWVKDNAGDKFISTDLITTAPTNYDSADFSDYAQM